MYIYQLIHQVYEKFRGLPIRLSENNGESPEWYRSHGYPSKSLDAFGNGNKCPEIEDYFKKIEQFEVAQSGAGRMLSHLVYVEIKARFCETDQHECSQRDLRRTGLKEATEAIQALDKKDFQQASNDDLGEMSKELCDLADWVHQAQERVNKEVTARNKQEIRLNNGFYS